MPAYNVIDKMLGDGDGMMEMLMITKLRTDDYVDKTSMMKMIKSPMIMTMMREM